MHARKHLYMKAVWHHLILFNIKNWLRIFHSAKTILNSCSEYFNTFQTLSACSGNHFLKQHFLLGGCILTVGIIWQNYWHWPPKHVGSLICKGLEKNQGDCQCGLWPLGKDFERISTLSTTCSIQIGTGLEWMSKWNKCG